MGSVTVQVSFADKHYVLPKDIDAIALLPPGDYERVTTFLQREPRGSMYMRAITQRRQLIGQGSVVTLIQDGVRYVLPDDISRVAALAQEPYTRAIRQVTSLPGGSRYVEEIARRRRIFESGGVFDPNRWPVRQNDPPSVLPPARRDAAWADIQNITAPFDEDHGGKDAQYFGYWFNYFWKEAREAYDLDATGTVQLCEAYFALFNQLDPAQLKVDVLEGANPKELTLPYVEQQMILLKVMRVGFRRVALHDRGGWGVPQAVDARTLFAERVLQTPQGTRILRLAFRGDTRTPEALAETGFIARARCHAGFVYADFGFDKPWHPFNLPIYRDCLFLRKGSNRDNCLHTAISVGADLRTVLQYPLMSDASLFRLAFRDPQPPAPAPGWTPDDYAYVQAEGFTVHRQGDRVDKLSRRFFVYILDISTGKGFHTQNYQSQTGIANPCSERGLEFVLPEQILAVAVVIKEYFYRITFSADIHHTRQAVITLMNVLLDGLRLLPPAEALQRQYGPQVESTIRLQVEQGIRAFNDSIASDRRAYEGQAPAAPRGAAQQAIKCPVCGAPCAKQLEASRHCLGRQ